MTSTMIIIILIILIFLLYVLMEIKSELEFYQSRDASQRKENERLRLRVQEREETINELVHELRMVYTCIDWDKYDAIIGSQNKAF